MANLNALYVWFDENREGIIKHHTSECVLLKDNEVIAYFPNDDTALEYAEKNNFLIGDFLIQDCITKDDECYVLI